MPANKIEQSLQMAITKAAALEINVSVAIVDQGGHLMAFRRMDGAIVGSVDVAISKARTSALFPMSSRDFGILCTSESLHGMLNTNGGLVGFAGGLPLPGGGGVGVSGGSADQDEIVAQVAVEHLYEPLV